MTGLQASRNSALRVSVLVTLEHGKAAGGHVKCWERFAEAACARRGDLDLTVHFLGGRDELHSLNDNVRFRYHRPVLGTRRFAFLKQGAGHTDLAPFHFALDAALADSDIIHATDFFSFGRTGLIHARRHRKGFVASIHTDTPQFIRVYAGDIIRRLTGNKVGGWLIDRVGLPNRIADRMSDSIDRRLRACHQVLVSKPEDHRRLSALVRPHRLSYLRRGIDRDRFSPAHRDRAWLAAEFGIPADRPVLMFAGRVDASKSVTVMAEAVHDLIQEGRDVQALVVGKGNEQARIAGMLGTHVTMPGNVSQEVLARLYASADLFLFPSTTEVCPNVVIEAKASGVPVVVAATHGGAQFIAEPGIDGFIAGDQEPASWAAIARDLLDDPANRLTVGRAARHWAERDWPSWGDVLDRELLAAWRAADAAAGGTTATSHRPALARLFARRDSKIGWSETSGR
jgi:glycosyltransferase involved in cell wall biosynthesis